MSSLFTEPNAYTGSSQYIYEVYQIYLCSMVNITQKKSRCDHIFPPFYSFFSHSQFCPIKEYYAVILILYTRYIFYSVFPFELCSCNFCYCRITEILNRFLVLFIAFDQKTFSPVNPIKTFSFEVRVLSVL